MCRCPHKLKLQECQKGKHVKSLPSIHKSRESRSVAHSWPAFYLTCAVSSCSLSTCECEDRSCLVLSLAVRSHNYETHFLFKWKLSLNKLMKPDLVSGCVYHPFFLSHLSVSLGTYSHTYTRTPHTPKHTVTDGPANASFPCRAPRATGCICVTEAGPAATGWDGSETEKGEGKGRGPWIMGDTWVSVKEGDSKRSEWGRRLVEEHRVAGRSTG